MPELKANGGDRRSEEFQSYTHNTENTQRGTKAEYRTRRLRRDHPEVFERMLVGEFENVAQAEEAAGIKKPSNRWNAPKDIKKLAETLKRRFTQEERQQLRELEW